MRFQAVGSEAISDLLRVSEMLQQRRDKISALKCCDTPQLCQSSVQGGGCRDSFRSTNPRVDRVGLEHFFPPSS